MPHPPLPRLLAAQRIRYLALFKPILAFSYVRVSLLFLREGKGSGQFAWKAYNCRVDSGEFRRSPAALAFYLDGLGHELIWRDYSAAGLRLPDSDAELVLHTEERAYRDRPFGCFGTSRDRQIC
jgi:hypothetical protein